MSHKTKRFNPLDVSSEQLLRGGDDILHRAKIDRTFTRNLGKKPIHPPGGGAMSTTRTRSRGGRNG